MVGVPEERVDWIDESGSTVRVLPRSEIRRRNLLHRVTATFVIRPDGQLFVQLRSSSKDVYPGLHDVCVGGTVVSGESAAANACREIAEEIGVRGVPIFRLFQHRFRDEHSHSLTEVFACTYEGEVTLQPEEVAGGFWAEPNQVRSLIAEGSVCPDAMQTWRLYEAQCRAEGDFHRRVAEGRLEPVNCTEFLVG